MLQFTIVHPQNEKRSEYIRMEDPEEEGSATGETVMQMFAEIGKYVHVRSSTDAEVKDLDDEEQDMEAHDADVGFFWPEDRQKILQFAWDWANPLTLEHIIHIVAANSSTECTTANAAHNYLSKNHYNRIPSRNVIYPLLEIINFPALREQCADIYAGTIAPEVRPAVL
jgi:hypothetical protein